MRVTPLMVGMLAGAIAAVAISPTLNERLALSAAEPAGPIGIVPGTSLKG